MALPGSLNSLIKFDRTTTPASFQFTDNTDYSGLGISEDDVRGIYKITDPLGNVIHNNTDFSSPDILGSSSLQYSGLPIPIDVYGDIVQGVYLVDYSIVVDDPITNINTGTKTIKVAGDRTALISNGDIITIVRSTSGDNGDYTVSGTPTYSGGYTSIVVVEAIPSATIGGASIQYANQEVYTATQQTATYSDIFPEISIEVVTDCFSGVLTSKDLTNYGSGTLNSRSHRVVYPAALNISDIVSPNAVVVVSPIYTKTWTTVITSNVTYTLASGVTVDVILTGSKDTVVACDLSLCQISCCVIALDNRYRDNLTVNPPKAAEDFAKLTRVFQLIEKFQMAQSCAQYNVANDALDEIRIIADCNEKCQCSDSDAPQQVIPLSAAAGATTTVLTEGTGISITSTVNGNTITYQVSISASVMNIINSLAPVNVVGSTGITVVKTVVGGVDTYTITNSAPFTPLNTQQFNVLLEYSNFAAPTLTITKSDRVSEGSNMADPTVTNAVGSIGVGNWKNQNNLFEVGGFQVSGNSTYKVFANVIQFETQDINGNVSVAGDQWLASQPVDVRILEYGSNVFRFQLVYKDTGVPVTNYGMVYFYKVMVQFLIKQ